MRSVRSPAALPAFPALLLLLPLLAGCLGAPEASDWAYRQTQLDALAPRDGTGVTVAVIDTGVDVRHPSLDHLADGDHGDGELVAFRDYLGGRDGVANAYDPDGHGTHVIGILAGKGPGESLLSGSVELHGPAPAVRLAVARVCDSVSCDAEAVPQAVRWAIAQRADVISLSLGGQSGIPPLLEPLVAGELEEAIDDAIGSGIVVVASAGNGGDCPGEDGGEPATDVATPADIPGVIAVAATQRDGRAWCGSSRGDTVGNPCRDLLLRQVGRCDPHKKPEVAAPGVDILSAWTDRRFASATGTSQATPFVAATVALMLQGQPDLRTRADVEEVKRAIVDTARPVPGAQQPHDAATGYGLLQARAAVATYQSR